MLPKGAAIPVHLLCSAGFAVCPYSFTPSVSHLNWTCRVHNSGQSIFRNVVAALRECGYPHSGTGLTETGYRKPENTLG